MLAKSDSISKLVITSLESKLRSSSANVKESLLCMYGKVHRVVMDGLPFFRPILSDTNMQTWKVLSTNIRTPTN